MSATQPLIDIVIVGGGTAGWMAANLMASRWGAGRARITVIESPEIGIIGVGEGSTPSLRRFFRKIGVEEADWMKACHATYKLNVRFEGWSPESGVAAYSHPFVSKIDSLNEQAFFVNCLTRRLGLDVTTLPDLFLLSGVLAAQGKGPANPVHFPFNIEYGYHFDSGLLGRFLADLAVSRGVKLIKATVRTAELSSRGDIVAVLGDNDLRITGDFFVDCTGFNSLLLQRQLGVPFRSFSSNLFNDSAVVIATAPPTRATLPVETVSRALSGGWSWHIPLTSRVGNGYVYSSAFLSADRAEAELRRSLGLTANSGEARHLKMKVGQVERHWERNCLALGLSQGFIEPLEATALHLVQVSIESFMTYYEEGQFTPLHQSRFNKEIVERFERIRDYIVAHYKLNTRSDSDYWRANRDNAQLSDALGALLQAWFDRSDIAGEIQRTQGSSHFGMMSWHCLLAGYGAFPPIAPDQPGTGDLYLEGGIKDFLNACALNFGSHDQCLQGEWRQAAGLAA
jgi:2-polyprenyl-6-methoxyphenol hydroxylase-like FAD-dependent oxidoreductase